MTESLKPHLLVVEDEAVIASLLTDVFPAGGYRVSVFHRVDEALVAARIYDDFAICLSDFMLPDRTGLDLVRALKELRPGLRVLLASAFLETEIEEQVRAESNVVAILRKPLDIFALVARVDALIGRSLPPKAQEATC